MSDPTNGNGATANDATPNQTPQASIMSQPNSSGENNFSGKPGQFPTPTHNAPLNKEKKRPTTKFEKDLKRMKFPWREEEVPLSGQTVEEFSKWLRDVVAARDKAAAGYTTTQLVGKRPAVVELFARAAFDKAVAAGTDITKVRISELVKLEPSLAWAKTSNRSDSYYRRRYRQYNLVRAYCLQVAAFATGTLDTPPPALNLRASEREQARLFNEIGWDLFNTGKLYEASWRTFVEFIMARVPYCTFLQTGKDVPTIDKPAEFTPDSEHRGDYE